MCTFHSKYTFWKIQRKNQEADYFHILPLIQFFWISKMVSCIPEVFWHLYCPTYIWYVTEHHSCHICHIMTYMTFISYVIHHMYVCQYRCQKKCEDLKTEISCFWIEVNALKQIVTSFIFSSSSWTRSLLMFRLLSIIGQA